MGWFTAVCTHPVPCNKAHTIIYLNATTWDLYTDITLASQMWTLGRYLPMMIGSEVPDDEKRWKCYCILVNITQHLFAPRLHENDLAILKMLIEDHHERFIDCYPSNSVIPKLHYLLHMPRLIYE